MANNSKILNKIFGDPQKRKLKQLQTKLEQTNALADKYVKMSDAELKKQTAVLRKRLTKKPLRWIRFCQMLSQSCGRLLIGF